MLKTPNDRSEAAQDIAFAPFNANLAMQGCQPLIGRNGRIQRQGLRELDGDQPPMDHLSDATVPGRRGVGASARKVH